MRYSQEELCLEMIFQLRAQIDQKGQVKTDLVNITVVPNCPSRFRQVNFVLLLSY